MYQDMKSHGKQNAKEATLYIYYELIKILQKVKSKNKMYCKYVEIVNSPHEQIYKID